MRRKSLAETISAERTQYATLHDAWEDIINPLSGANPVAEHVNWHNMHGPGGGGPGAGEEFINWHRYYIRRLEGYFGANGAHHSVPIPYWDPMTTVPTELRGGPGEITDPNPMEPTPSWATIAGGATPSPIFAYTSLLQFKSTDELGRAAGAGLHGILHSPGGTLDTFESPSVPIFFSVHGYLDYILEEWRHRAVVVPTPIARGNVGSPGGAGIRINLFVRGADGKLWERYWNGSTWGWVDTGKEVLGRAVALVRGNPASRSGGDIRINLFIQGADRKLWERYWNGSTWSWNDTGKVVDGEPFFLVRGNPASRSGGDIRINLFIRASDGKLWERYWNGSTWAWVDTGKEVAGYPVAVVRGDREDVGASDLRINLFVRGTDGKLWERYWNGSTWSWVDTGKEVADDPIVIARGSLGSPDAAGIRINLFVKAKDGKLWERYWNGSTWAWVDHGKGIFSRPVALVRGNTASTSGADVRINLFMQGSDGKLWERYWNGSTWSWVDHGKEVDGQPLIIARGNLGTVDGAAIRINMFVRAVEYTLETIGGPHLHEQVKLWERYWNGSTWSWRDTAKEVGGDPIAVVRGDVEDVGADDLRINLFVAAADGKLWEHYWNGSAWSWSDTGRGVPV